MTEEAQLIELEACRCHAVSNGDTDALATLLTDDYIHVHATGQIDNLRQHIAVIQERPRRVTRGPLHIRIYQHFAVIVGDQTNISADARLEAVATQIAQRTDDGWKFVSMQVTRKLSRPRPHAP